MPRRHNNKGRSTIERFVSVPHFLLRSPAWHDLSPIATKILLHVMSLYNGSNNGRLAVSSRVAAKVGHCSKDTAATALRELVAKGFLEVAKPGGFSRKTPHATEYRVTVYGCDRTNSRASRAFMAWMPPQKNRTRSDGRDSRSDQKDSSGLRAIKLPITVLPTGPLGLKTALQRSDHRDTCNLPGGGQ